MFTSLNPNTLSITASLDEGLRLARAYGFEGLDLPMSEVAALAERGSAQQVKDRFAAAGVRPGAWSLPLDFRRDEATYREGLSALPRYAALARELGSPWCYTVVMPFSDELEFAANMERHVQRLRPIAQALAEQDCRLGLEFIGPKTLRAAHTHEFIYTIDGALDLAARIGTGNVGLLLDSFHWYTAHGTLDELRRLSAAQVVYVHVNDAVAGRGPDEQLDLVRMLPGASGVIDLAGFMQALDAMGYAGPVVVEPFSDEVKALAPDERVRVAAQSLQTLWQRAGL